MGYHIFLVGQDNFQVCHRHGVYVGARVADRGEEPDRSPAVRMAAPSNRRQIKPEI
jgi:hypothetical protein